MYEKSRDSSRGFADSYSNLASIYGADGKLRMARINLNTALKINPYHYTSYVNLAILEAKLNNESKAFSNFNKAVQITKTSVAAYWNRGNLFLKKNRYNEAIMDFRKVLAINPLFCNVSEKLISLSSYFDKKLLEELNIALINNRNHNNCLYLH